MTSLCSRAIFFNTRNTFEKYSKPLLRPNYTQNSANAYWASPASVFRLYPYRWRRWNGRRLHLYNLKLARARIPPWGSMFSWICQLLMPIYQRVFQNSTLAHGYDKRGSTEKKKRSNLAEERFLDARGSRSFQVLVDIFTNPRLLVHFDAKRLIRLETDASAYSISGILSQKQETEWKVVAHFSHKMIDVERNYEIHYAELLAIIESFCHCCHYLKQPYHTVEVLTDHSNPHAFMSTYKLMQRQVWWALDLSAFDFRLVYRKGTLNHADGP